jgi:hypothetical protein
MAVRCRMIRRIALIALTALLFAAPIIYTAFPMDRMVFAAIVTAVGLAAWGLARKEVQE